MKNNDLDFIKEKFENSNVNAPESINEDFVMSKIREIEDIDVNNEAKVLTIDKKSKKSRYKFISAMAACLAVVVMATAIIPSLIGGSTIKSSALVSSRSGKNVLRSFDSYGQVESAVKKAMENKPDTKDVISYYLSSTMTSSTKLTSSVLVDKAIAPSASNTYVQVDGVKEGAKVKTNGKYIFSVDYNQVDVYKVAGKKTKKIKTITPKSIIYDLYLIDDYLIIISEKEWNYQKELSKDRPLWFYSTNTIAEVYDISDIENITGVSSFIQSGSYCSSRLIDNELYLVSTSEQYDEKNIEMPCTGNGKKITCPVGEDNKYFSYNKFSYDRENNKISPENIYTIDNPSDSSFSVISRVNINDMENDKESKAVLGAANEIYCNLNNLYIAGDVYVNTDTATGDEATDDEPMVIDTINNNTINNNTISNNISWSVNNPDTQIVKINIENGLDIIATATVKGAIDNQYSFDEYKDNLRVATTVYGDKDTNYLYVLDKNLGELGTVENFGKGESIKAVKYVNDYAYVITYRETDPLFVINLSDPQKPEIMGKVKIDGFSSMLVPIDDNNLLGIGYHTDINEDEGEFTDGVKLVLFDVSNKAKPKVLDTKVFENSYSTVQENPRALVVNESRGNYTIPITFEKEIKAYDEEFDYWYEDWEEKGGQVTFSIKNNKIVVENKYKSNKLETGEYCVFVDDNIYILGAESGDIDCVAYNN